MNHKMKKYILFITLLVSLYGSGCQKIKTVANLHDSTWDMMRADFRLKQPSNKAVNDQIKFLTKRKDIIEDATRHAPLFLYHIVQECQKRDLPSELALVAMIESEFNPYAHSKVGASGMWQMMPSTASGLKLDITWWNDERRDIVKSTDAALRYLAYLKDSLGTWEFAIAAYDAGEGRLRRLISKYPTRSVWELPLPDETKRYLVKIFAARAMIAEPETYDVQLKHVSAKPYFTKISTRKHIDIDALASDLQMSPKEFRALNASHRRLSTEKDTITDFYIPISHVQQAKKFLNSPRSTNHLIYTVKSKDTLHSIAKKLGYSAQFIKKINNLSDDNICVGQKLLVNRAPQRTPQDHATISADSVPGPMQHWYEVKQGDTLMSIAKKYGVTYQAIIYWNQVKAKKLPTGSCLIIWTDTSKSTYTVLPGDTLSQIALRHKTTVPLIQQANKMSNTLIRAGQKIRIPARA